MSYETRYVIVAGIAWIRTTRMLGAETLWAVTFDGPEPVVRRGPAGDSTIERGSLDGFEWELAWDELAPPFATPHPALRKVAPTRLVTRPAVLVRGRIGDRTIEAAPGHIAEIAGRRHARTWGWAHASTADGRYVHLLTASAPPLPRVSQYATERRRPGLPLARGSVAPPAVTVGPYTVEADPTTFVGLEYTDTDGSSVWCYHSEAGRLRGPGVDLDGAAMEIAVRERLPGWRVAP